MTAGWTCPSGPARRMFKVGGSGGCAARSKQMPIVNRIAAMHDEITAWRRDIHAHPELLYDVQRTAATVADKLKRFGCDDVVTGIGRTGVVGVIRGGKGGEGGRVIGLRADMDALPIEEAGDVPYKSTVPGKMHACGHDGHTAMLLGAADRITIEIEGRGGHAARPHVAIDTVLVGAQIINQIQSIVARNVDPLSSAVISICVFQAGSTDNVIPQTALLRGTARSLTPEVRDLLEKRLHEVVTGTAQLYGATAKQTYRRDYPVTRNHERQAAFAASVAGEVVGRERVDDDVAPVMGAEDFSFMLEARPGAFIFVGNGDSAGLHHPAYDFNDEAIPIGASYWVKLVETALPG